MASSPAAAPAARPTEPRGSGPSTTSPVAVVWCRQVDNEAESPGYTTVPEDFPGLRETLDAIRIVGHLTVNVADTHDYWDPDPAQPLSYYPNIFLYPASGGRYTCLGRMFLSTEDRPRLGMKTLVLDTQQLLATGDFGGTVLRWHASMGGPRGEGSRPPPVPDPKLYDTLGEGFLFHKGTTEPVVAVASDAWDPSMQVVLDLIRTLPASLVALGAILAFPYFLPQAKTNLHEFTEQVPLALALMRVPRGEASGDRHQKRMESWESAPVTLRDLTVPLPASPKGKDSTPLVLQYARDHAGDKLGPIVQRVDLVELARLAPHLGDPERQGGRDRRKEMWRIGTAMESAALLMLRARGRHVPVPVETAKRAQEYLQARLPEVSDGRAMGAVAGGVAGTTEVTAPGLHPPWLQRSGPAPPTPAAPAREVVPVSVSEDPSLLSADQRPAPMAAPAPAPIAPPPGAAMNTPPAPAPSPPPVATPPVTSAPVAPTLMPPAGAAAPVATATPAPTPVSRPPMGVATPPVAAATASPAKPPSGAVLSATPPATTPPSITTADLAALRTSITADFLRVLDDRLAAIHAKIPASGLDGSAREELRSQLVAQRESLVAETAGQIALLQDRLFREQTALEGRLKTSVGEALNQSIDRKFSERIDPKIAELGSRADAAGRSAGDAAAERLQVEFDRLRAELATTTAASEESLRTSLSGQVEAHFDEAAKREAATQSALEAWISSSLDARAAAMESGRQRDLKDLETKVTSVLDARAVALETGRQRDLKDLEAKVTSILDARAVTIEARRQGDRKEAEVAMAATLDARRAELLAQLDARARELESSLAGAVDARHSDLEAHRQIDAHELEQRLNARIDERDQSLTESITARRDGEQGAAQRMLEERIAQADARLERRSDALRSELTDAQVRAIADLQVRLQAYTDTKLREDVDRERQKYLELLARLRGEVETTVSRLVDSTRFDESIREKVERAIASEHAELERAAVARATVAEEAGRSSVVELRERLGRIDAGAEELRDEMHKLDESVRTELDDLDRRAQILADRLVPVVRRTWARITELEGGGGSTAGKEALDQLRQQMDREVRRLDGEIGERFAEVRERMETAISNQGRVWLTLVRQLSQLTEDRRVIEEGKALLKDRTSARDESTSLEALPSLLQSRRTTTPTAEDDEEPEADRSRRRRRSFSPR